MRIRRREFLRSTAAIPNAGEKLYSPSLRVVAGKVKIPDGPGWGVRINPTWLEKATYQKSERPAR